MSFSYFPYYFLEWCTPGYTQDLILTSWVTPAGMTIYSARERKRWGTSAKQSLYYHSNPYK